jgi:hypothetical protein
LLTQSGARFRQAIHSVRKPCKENVKETLPSGGMASRAAIALCIKKVFARWKREERVWSSVFDTQKKGGNFYQLPPRRLNPVICYMPN